MLCLLSVLLASTAVFTSGAWEPAARMLHQWSVGVLMIFLLIFAVSMFLALRGRLARSPWTIPVSAVLACPAATLAYLVYFSMFEPQRIMKSLAHSGVFDAIVILVFLVPSSSFAWLFGAVAGAAFYFLGRALQIGTQT